MSSVMGGGGYILSKATMTHLGVMIRMHSFLSLFITFFVSLLYKMHYNNPVHEDSAAKKTDMFAHASPYKKARDRSF